MRILWRISNYPSLNGLGGIKSAGRWHSKGHEIVYCSENSAGALTEMLVHQDKEDFPETFRLLRIEIDEPASVRRITANDLPVDWINRLELTRELGDSWLAGCQSLLLEVPSALVPESQNVLINPKHPDMVRCKITAITDAPLDPRFG